MTSRKLVALAAAGMFLVSACGTTLATGSRQPAGGTVAQSGSGSDAALGTAGNQAPSGASSGPPSQPADRQAAAGAATGIVVGGSPTAASANSAAGGPAPGGGHLNTSPIEVGFIAGKCSNCTALGTAYTPPTYTDQQLEQAAVNGINSRGGIGGRKIHPVFATVDTASTSWTTDYQAACATFTQDHHVVAVLGYSFAYEDNLATCLAKAGVLWINGGYGAGDANVYKTHPYYFSDIAPTEDDELVVSVSSALEDGWISPRSRLGILQASCAADARAFNNSLKPYLASHHLNLASTQTINCVTGAQDDGNAAALIQHAELQMRTDGVDSVIITGIPLILFAENAESQHWRPHYLAYLGGAAYEPYLPAAQLSNIHAAGWLPTLDLDATHLPPLSSAQQRCKDLLHQGGIDVPPSQYTPGFIACDAVTLYARAVTVASGDASPSVVSNALQSLGTGYVSPMTLNGATNFTASQHAGPQQFRSNLYQAGCACFQYVGPARPLPAL